MNFNRVLIEYCSRQEIWESQLNGSLPTIKWDVNIEILSLFSMNKAKYSLEYDISFHWRRTKNSSEHIFRFFLSIFVAENPIDELSTDFNGTMTFEHLSSEKVLGREPSKMITINVRQGIFSSSAKFSIAKCPQNFSVKLKCVNDFSLCPSNIHEKKIGTESIIEIFFLWTKERRDEILLLMINRRIVFSCRIGQIDYLKLDSEFDENIFAKLKKSRSIEGRKEKKDRSRLVTLSIRCIGNEILKLLWHRFFFTLQSISFSSIFRHFSNVCLNVFVEFRIQFQIVNLSNSTRENNSSIRHQEKNFVSRLKASEEIRLFAMEIWN